MVIVVVAAAEVAPVDYGAIVAGSAVVVVAVAEALVVVAAVAGKYRFAA